ncbi:hypothetical protein LSCM1_03559 [Leishmania martiniquensis]|uniref:ICAM-like surface protein n=1 Tax=Leishmania martiniquensis TaxID=1580590 RepID=A0A836GI19_9TRYP|nr:hypothetical protein LSCM1_03559 [Leishmania martiniquensis]
MTQQRARRARPSKPATVSVSASVPDPAPFFSMGSASLTDAIAVTKVISVVLPLRHLRDRDALHTALLKKLLHRPYEPSAEDLAQQQEVDNDGKHGHGAYTSLDDHAASTSSSSSLTPYVIVHIKSAEVHSDTARQVNPRGDVQVNVMVTLVAARLQHGICAGVSEASPFTSCMQVRVPTVAVSAAVAARGSTDDAALLLLRASSTTSTDNVPHREGHDVEVELSNGDATVAAKHRCRTGVPEDQQLRVTARCLEDEPIVPGQAVLLVSEPAAMRCIGIRPPRAAPGPFFFSGESQRPLQSSSEAPEVGPELAPKKRARKSRAPAADTDAATSARRVVVIECEIPKREEGGKGGEAACARKGQRKRPHT